MSLTRQSPLEMWVEEAYAKIHPVYSGMPNHGIPEPWLGGLVYVEDSRMDPQAHRFEEGVHYAMVGTVKGIESRNFPGFSSGTLGAYLKHNSDEATLIDMSTSWGITQIMGYNYYEMFGLTPQQFRHLTLEDSIRYSLQRMSYGISHGCHDYLSLLRWWNTGNPNGKTFSPTYVSNAMHASDLYAKLLEHPR